jgi:hypothetical protein
MSTTTASNRSPAARSHAIASSTTTSTRGSSSAPSLAATMRGVGAREPSTAGSSSTSTTRSTASCCSTSRAASPSPAAEHQHERAPGHDGRVDQRLVVAVLVAAGELQVAVEEQPHVVGAARLG